MDFAAIGLRIREARERQSLTQAALATRVGVTRSAVAQWETGRSGQVGGNLARVADTLGVGVEHLLLGAAPAQVGEELGWRTTMPGDELSLVRLYRELGAEDRSMILRMMRRLALDQHSQPEKDVATDLV